MRINIEEIPAHVTAIDLARAMHAIGIHLYPSGDIDLLIGRPHPERHGNTNIVHMPRHRRQRVPDPQGAA